MLSHSFAGQESEVLCGIQHGDPALAERGQAVVLIAQKAGELAERLIDPGSEIIGAERGFSEQRFDRLDVMEDACTAARSMEFGAHDIGGQLLAKGPRHGLLCQRGKGRTGRGRINLPEEPMLEGIHGGRMWCFHLSPAGTFHIEPDYWMISASWISVSLWL